MVQCISNLVNSEIFIGKCFKELSFAISLFEPRADTADVSAKSKYHNYSLVSDAKAFRLSLTAKNQQDFDVETIDFWMEDNNHAVLCIPYYQYSWKTTTLKSRINSS